MASTSGLTSDSGSSLVWKYFERLDGEKAKCQLCHNSYSRKGGSTSGLINHLRSMHKSNYKKLLEEDDKRIKLHQTLQTEKTALQTAKLEAKQAASLTSWLAKDVSKTIDYRIAEMICLDDLPFSFVEGLGFVRFVSKALPNYNLKGRKFYAQLVSAHIYESVSKVVSLKIKNMKHNLSFTIDEWSEISASISLLSLTCHGITEDFKRVKIVLCAKPLFEKKTGEYIAEKFNEMISSWDIPVSKIHAVMRDSGANMKCALKIAKVDNYDCTAHKLQLVVSAGIEAQRTVKDIIAKCKRIALHFNHSITAQEQLKQQQIRLNLPELKMVQDVATRWNSTFYMLKRTLEIKESLHLYLASDNASSLPYFNPNEWNIMQKCINVLAPFEHLTRKLSESSASISDVIPMIKILRSFCEDKNDDSDCGILSMKETLRTELNRRFNALETVQAYTVATYLDPRYKGKVFTNDEIVEQTKEVIIKLCTVLCDEKTDAQLQRMIGVDQTQGPVREALAAKGRNEESLSFQDRLKALINAGYKEQDSEDAGLARFQKKAKKEISIKNMIEDYNLQNNIEIDEDPLKWWNENKNQYSLLSEIAQSYLACPPTSVPSEQLFSGAGLIYTPQRNRLKGENAEKLLFLKYNLPFVNFEYEI